MLKVFNILEMTKKKKVFYSLKTSKKCKKNVPPIKRKDHYLKDCVPI